MRQLWSNTPWHKGETVEVSVSGPSAVFELHWEASLENSRSATFDGEAKGVQAKLESDPSDWAGRVVGDFVVRHSGQSVSIKTGHSTFIMAGCSATIENEVGKKDDSEKEWDEPAGEERIDGEAVFEYRKVAWKAGEKVELRLQSYPCQIKVGDKEHYDNNGYGWSEPILKDLDGKYETFSWTIDLLCSRK